MLSPTPLIVRNKFLEENLPSMFLIGPENIELSIQREMVSLNYHTEEEETQLIRCYYWRVWIRGWIIFWNDSRALQFLFNSLQLSLSFLFLLYDKYALVLIVAILLLLIPFFLSKGLILMLYIGRSMDIEDSDFGIFLWFFDTYKELEIDRRTLETERKVLETENYKKDIELNDLRVRLSQSRRNARLKMRQSSSNEIQSNLDDTVEDAKNGIHKLEEDGDSNSSDLDDFSFDALSLSDDKFDFELDHNSENLNEEEKEIEENNHLQSEGLLTAENLLLLLSGNEEDPVLDREVNHLSLSSNTSPSDVSSNSSSSSSFYAAEV